MLHHTRQCWWPKVYDAAPSAMRAGIDTMNNEEKAVFLVSGFRCDYTPEWEELYIATINFCYVLYKQRREKATDIDALPHSTS